VAIVGGDRNLDAEDAQLRQGGHARLDSASRVGPLVGVVELRPGANAGIRRLRHPEPRAPGRRRGRQHNEGEHQVHDRDGDAGCAGVAR